MRILHTSDWHLGRSFHSEGLLGHQASFVDHLVEVVESERVDVVAVAGDVYDRALPGVDAVALADEAFTRLTATGAAVVVTSGNHDSARRLGFGSRLLDRAGLFVRTDPAGVGTPILLEDAHGPVAVHALPWLDPTALLGPWDLPGRSHEATLGEAMRRVRHDLAGRPGVRSVVLAHAFVAGAQPSESERDISVGGVSRVPVSTFDEVSYTALGHLHGRHRLADGVRYSGSPLAYSFSEAAHTKGSWLVDLGATGVDAAHFVEAPVPRPLATLTGAIDELLSDPRHVDLEDHWLQVVLTDPVRPRQAMERLRRRFPHTLVLGFAPAGAEPSAAPRVAGPGRSDHDIALDFVRELRGVPATDAESGLLREAVDACCGDADLTRERALALAREGDR